MLKNKSLLKNENSVFIYLRIYVSDKKNKTNFTKPVIQRSFYFFIILYSSNLYPTFVAKYWQNFLEL